ncbi:MAG: trypsin-like serine protease [Proteobacteria bacterium]|nr:MAG: trypsin-like serine protease [Pseudomonadota bacterium]
MRTPPTAAWDGSWQMGTTGHTGDLLMLSKLRTLSGTTAIAAAAAIVGLTGCSKFDTQGSVAASNDSSIIGGQDSTGDEDFSRTIVALYNVREGFICTGSLLSNDLVLTAAHCVVGEASDTIVVFHKDAINTVATFLKPIADSNGSLDDLPATAPIRRATAYRVSPVWEVKQNDLLNTGDIALLKFKGGMVKGFQRAALLSNAALLKNGQSVILSGYGTNDGVKDEGSGLLRFVETTIQQTDYTQSEILIEQSLGKGACHGDSGGPAYVEIEGKKFVIGVTSRGVNDLKNDCSVSAAYTGVPFYAKWLVAAVKELKAIPEEAADDKVLPLPAPSKPAEGKPAQSVADAS